jgi:hypothetical protein
MEESANGDKNSNQGNNTANGETADSVTRINTTEPNFLSDFILVSEFSELEGPVPLFVIPEGSQGRFNINDFVLRIMAVDYHNNKNSDITQLSADSQLFLVQPSENSVAYVSTLAHSMHD